MRITLQALIAAGGAVLCLGPALPAQRLAAPALSLSAGLTQYDLSGVGNGRIAGARIALPVRRAFVLEPAVMYFRYQSQFGARVTYLFPEVTFQVQARLDDLRPYVGAGAGVYAVFAGSFDMDVTIHAAAGFRVDVAERWGVRFEGRLRSLGPVGGNISDASFGVSRALR